MQKKIIKFLTKLGYRSTTTSDTKKSRNENETFICAIIIYISYYLLTIVSIFRLDIEALSFWTLIFSFAYNVLSGSTRLAKGSEEEKRLKAKYIKQGRSDMPNFHSEIYQLPISIEVVMVIAAIIAYSVAYITKGSICVTELFLFLTAIIFMLHAIVEALADLYDMVDFEK